MKRTLTVIAVAVAAAAAGGAWYLHAKQPLRNGSLAVAHLQAPVDVRYDERGVPHLYAQNQTDLYRALGYVHAQDRLFQMEMLRRLARGELAEVLGPKLVDTDRLFRTLRIRDHAAEYSARQDKQSQPWKVLEAYLDGVNQFQENNPAPLEFDLLDIPRRPFTPEDTLSIAGYMAYSFAAAFRTEPVLTYIRDELGSDYLRIFDLDWHPQGVLTPSGALGAGDWKDLGALARLSQQALEVGVGTPGVGTGVQALRAVQYRDFHRSVLEHEQAVEQRLALGQLAAFLDGYQGQVLVLAQLQVALEQPVQPFAHRAALAGGRHLHAQWDAVDEQADGALHFRRDQAPPRLSWEEGSGLPKTHPVSGQHR